MHRFMAKHHTLVFLGVLLLVSVGVFAATAQAQAVPALTFTAKTTTGTESVVPELTWAATPAGATCTASGDWTGAKAASGTATLAAVTSSRTYILKCDWPANTSAKLTWVPPTANTDGSTLTDLAGYKIKYGTSASSLTTVFDLPTPGATTQTMTGLIPATWFFGVAAYNSAGVESSLSNVVSKVITVGSSASRTVAITVNPKPNPPSAVTVE